jgi:hypothetical protein
MRLSWRRLVVVVAIGLVGAAWVLTPTLPGLPCPLRHWTGVDCLGCGLTRACRALLRGNVLAALSLHPLSLVVVPGIALGVVRWATGWCTGRTWPSRLPRPLTVALWTGFVVAVVVVVVTRGPPLFSALVGALARTFHG